MFFCFTLSCKQKKTPSVCQCLYCSFVTFHSVGSADSAKRKKKGKRKRKRKRKRMRKRIRKRRNIDVQKKKNIYAFLKLYAPGKNAAQIIINILVIIWGMHGC